MRTLTTTTTMTDPETIMIEQSKFRVQWGVVLDGPLADAQAAHAVHHGATVKVATMLARNGDHVDVIWESRGFGLMKDGRPITGVTRSMPVLLAMVDSYPVVGPLYEGSGSKVAG